MLRVACVVVLALTLGSAATRAAVATSDEQQSLLGLSREDVTQAFGKPQSVLKRGETEVLVFANGMRVEIMAGKVSAIKNAGESVMVGADGQRYIATESGKAQRVPAGSESLLPAGLAPAPTVPPASANAEQEVDDIVESEPSPNVMAPDFHDIAPAFDQSLMDSVEKLANQSVGMPKMEPPPVEMMALACVLSVGARFGVALLALAGALRFHGLPYFWSDLCKVACGYVVAREGLHAVGAMGGYFQFIHFFKVDDFLSFVLLSVLLYYCKVASNGLVALKTAAPAKAGIYAVMMMVNLALSFSLLATKIGS